MNEVNTFSHNKIILAKCWILGKLQFLQIKNTYLNIFYGKKININFNWRINTVSNYQTNENKTTELFYNQNANSYSHKIAKKHNISLVRLKSDLNLIQSFIIKLILPKIPE